MKKTKKYLQNLFNQETQGTNLKRNKIKKLKRTVILA